MAAAACAVAANSNWFANLLTAWNMTGGLSYDLKHPPSPAAAARGCRSFRKCGLQRLEHRVLRRISTSVVGNQFLDFLPCFTVGWNTKRPIQKDAPAFGRTNPFNPESFPDQTFRIKDFFFAHHFSRKSDMIDSASADACCK